MTDHIHSYASGRAVLCPVPGAITGLASADITTAIYETRGAPACAFRIATSSDDIGILYMRGSVDSVTWDPLSIPASAVHNAVNVALANGALANTGACSALLILKDFPPYVHFFWDADGGGSGGFLTIKAG